MEKYDKKKDISWSYIIKIYAEKARQLQTQFSLRRKVKEKKNRDWFATRNNETKCSLSSCHTKETNLYSQK